jgi:pimeloyl-ACP methyl ester carboxylesterase
MSSCDSCIFIHGLFGSSQGVKATILKELFPKIVVPDFTGPLAERMAVLNPILDNRDSWTIVGSSFGGLMGAIYTCRNPERVRKLVLFAPALVWQDYRADMLKPVAMPVIIYHGKRDEIVPMEPVKQLAEKVFENLDFRIVDDDHGLYKTVHEIDWLEVIT